MWSEILRIKTVLDNSSAQLMESKLTTRFQKVAKFFSRSLQTSIKGSVLGISVGLLNKLLNPIEHLEEKVKGLLQQGTDLSDLSERFNTSPGQLKQLQDSAQAVGVNPDQFKELITKYAEAIEKARQEIANPFQERSATTFALKEFVNEQDLAKSFTSFLSSLKAKGQGEGDYAPLSDRARRIMNGAALQNRTLSDDEIKDLVSGGEIRKMSGVESRKLFEQEVFGGAQYGASQRLIQADIPSITQKLNEPSMNQLNAAISKTSQLAEQQRILSVQNQTQDFVNASNNMNSNMIQGMANAERATMDRETKQLQSFEDLQKTALVIDQLKGRAEESVIMLNKGISYLADIASSISNIKGSRIIRGLFGGGNE